MHSQHRTGTASSDLGSTNHVCVAMMLARGPWQVPSRLAICGPRLGARTLGASRSFSDNPSGEEKNVVRRYKLRTPVEKRGPNTSSRKPYRPETLDRSSIIFQTSDEVESAIAENRPVVALETTIYTHGFPYPDNLSLALDLEKIVRANGAIPATVGIIDGVAKIGLTKNEIERLASSAGNPDTMKVSRRDLPYILGMVCQLTFSSP
jgi:pseudouridine-5'-phosphate glycosidase/pseudouridine kinase